MPLPAATEALTFELPFGLTADAEEVEVEAALTVLFSDPILLLVFCVYLPTVLMFLFFGASLTVPPLDFGETEDTGRELEPTPDRVKEPAVDLELFAVTLLSVELFQLLVCVAAAGRFLGDLEFLVDTIDSSDAIL